MNRRTLTPTLLLLVSGSLALAQGTQTSSISGRVLEQDGHSVADALVRATSPSLQGERSTRTDADGRFAFRLLPPGDYRIVVTKEGFQSLTIHDHLGLERNFQPNLVLARIGGATVEVVASAGTVDTADTKMASNFTKTTIDALPVDRSSLLDIAYLAPSVVQNMNSDRGSVQIRGSMGTGNLIMVDGQNIMDNLYAGQRIGIVFDAVEETQVITGAIPAEYGQVEGGVINSITKTGGDQFTGSLRIDAANLGKNAVKPMDDRANYPNAWALEKTFTLGGPIIPSKLWFFIALYEFKPDSTIGFSTSAANSPYLSYVQQVKDTRQEYKLTWAVTPTNTVTWSYSGNTKDTTPQDYGAGDLAGLTNLVQVGRFWNVAWNSILTDKLTFTAKVGAKTQVLPTAATPGQGVAPIYNLADGLIYDQSWFDPNDPKPDTRKNRTASAKLSYFWDGLGSHETDFGFDAYQGTTEASGALTPYYTSFGGLTNVNTLFQVDAFDYPTQTFKALSDGSTQLQTFQYVPDKLTANTRGLFLNDKWSPNANFILNLGLRWDGYTADDQVSGSILNTHAFSPRLGLKWDPNGRGDWGFGASYNRLNGRILESTLQNRSYVNFPIYRYYNWTGVMDTYLPVSALLDLTNYATTPSYVLNNPANQYFDPSLKPQAVDEYQVTANHNFRTANWGSGYARLTAVNKIWKNLIDYTVGNNGSYTDPSGAQVYNYYWHNNDQAKRSYRSLEFEAGWTKGGFNLSGNIVWSRLWGNFVGEKKSNPGVGQGLNYFTTQDGVAMYDGAIANPMGYLPGQEPLRMRWTVNYTRTSFLGKQNFGLLYRFDGGLHYDETRPIPLDALNMSNPYTPFSDYAESGPQMFQYLNNKRGSGIFPSQAFLDASFQQDFTLVTLKDGRPVSAFLKIDVRNVFNHMQIASWDTLYASPANGLLSDPWVGANTNPITLGQPVGPGNYGEARSLHFSFGLKF